MATSRVPDAIDAVVSLLTTAVGSAGTVYDGPVVTGEVPAVGVYVGYDGDPDGDFAAVDDWAQEWRGLGAQAREETFAILCAVVATVGADGVQAARNTVFAVMDLVETVLRVPKTNINLGMAEVWAQMSSGGYLQEPTSQGLQVRIPFRVGVKARI